MDTSETYIKMCEKAEEIQKPMRMQDTVSHGYYYCPTHKEMWGYEDGGYQWCPMVSCEERPIWLPRQDQLQEMLDYLKIGRDYPAQSGWLTYMPPTLMALQDFLKCSWVWESWEQLWLAFVMKEKYNKAWDGENWITQEEDV